MVSVVVLPVVEAYRKGDDDNIILLIVVEVAVTVTAGDILRLVTRMVGGE